MRSPVSKTGAFSSKVQRVAGLLLVAAGLTSGAGAQGPALTYEKKASWAETLVALRSQAAGRPGLFYPLRPLVGASWSGLGELDDVSAANQG